MKSFFNKLNRQVGVSLIEVLLVLGIAAMIIVIAVRYYQSTTVALQTTVFVNQMIKLQEAADLLAQQTHSYDKVTTEALKVILGEKGLITPWGWQINVSHQHSDFFDFQLYIPAQVCKLALPQLAKTGRWSAVNINRLVNPNRDCIHHYSEYSQRGSLIQLAISPHKNDDSKYNDTT